MHKRELPELSQRLSQLADALGGKAPSPAGLLVWGDALSECERDDVLNALSDWPKSHAKMPVPAEMLKACRERAAARREQQAGDDLRAEKSAPGLRAAFQNADSEIARRELAKIKHILSDCHPGLVAGSFAPISGRPNADPKDWARVLRVKHESGETLSLYQIEAYKGALGLQ